MRKLFGILILLTLTGCSYLTDFYIFNKTEKTISIEYKVKQPLKGDPFTFDPRIVEFDLNMRIIEIKNAYEFDFNNEKNTLTCELKSGQALWIGDDLNFSLKNPNDTESLKRNLIYLKIKTAENEIDADEKNIVELFKTFDRHTVGIEIE